MERKHYRLIALDLDGTLLNSQKELTPRNCDALYRAAEQGIHIVPTTGRFYGGMPEVIRDLPFIRYCITINGAEVRDLQTGEVIYKAEIPCRQAVELMEYLDQFPVIYDCYQDNDAFMTASLKAQTDAVVENPHSRELIHRLRKPVPELKAFLLERGRAVQKVQFFTRDEDALQHLREELPRRFPQILAANSLPQNLELNHIRANKGEALLALAKHLHIPREETLAFGDGDNDITMLQMAGLGVAMENACLTALAAADTTTASCDEDGVALGIEQYCL